MGTQDVNFVAGDETLIGAALLRVLREEAGATVLGSAQAGVDLHQGAAVRAFFQKHRPRRVYLAAGRTGGIAANQKYPADLMHDNLVTMLNVVEACHEAGAKLLYLASSCSYPRLSPQPMRVESLMTGPLEPTNEAYATAKLAGLRLCQAYRRQFGDDFVVGIPANGFGEEDDFGEHDSHVIGALMQRMDRARRDGAPSITVWGTGQARREFIFADDLARACRVVMERYSDEVPINLGGGSDVSITELASLIREVVGYTGEIRYDTSKPDGMPLKALDGSALARLGWKPQTTLRQGLERTYAAFLKQRSAAESVPSPRPTQGAVNV